MSSKSPNSNSSKYNQNNNNNNSTNNSDVGVKNYKKRRGCRTNYIPHLALLYLRHSNRYKNVAGRKSFKRYQIFPRPPTGVPHTDGLHGHEQG